ncbi:MAG: hypothetical protein AAF921_07165 [Cyanobacteria bacterium P01_D01_bin.44]
MKKEIHDWVWENKILTAILLLFGSEVILYFLILPSIATSAYEGGIFSFLRRFSGYRPEEPFELYLNKAKLFFWADGLTIIFLALGLSFIWRRFKRRSSIRHQLQTVWLNIKKFFTINRKTLLINITIFLAFYGLYWVLGHGLLRNILIYNKFTFFFADQGDWTDLNWAKFHKGSHPLILIFLLPFSMLKPLSSFMPKPVLAVFINAFFGSLGVSLSYSTFWHLTRARKESLLLTIIFGFSMSQLFFSSLLESYAFAGVSILTTFLVYTISLRERSIQLESWIASGLLTFGVTITNFGHTLVCFGSTLLSRNKNNKIATFFEFIGIVFLAAFLISIIQKRIMGGSYFFVPEMLTRELKFIKTTVLNSPLLVSFELFKHFCLVNIVSASPFPTEIIPGEKVILSFFDRPLRYSWIGLGATSVWLIFLIVGLFKGIRSAITHKVDASGFEQRTFLITILGVNTFNLLLYSIFNAEEMFLFACNYTFPILLLVANKSMISWKYFTSLACLLIGLMALNNLSIMRQIIVF